MLLTDPQIDRFYNLMTPLLIFVNDEMNIHDPFVSEKTFRLIDAETENELRIVLWRNPHLIKRFLRKNPFGLSREDLDVVSGWRNFKFGDFTLCKVVRGVGIVLAHDNPQTFYSVYPLHKPFKALLPDIPIILRTALIPFEGVIVYDGSMASYGVRFGPGLRSAASDWYIDAYERGLIKTTLPESTLTVPEQVFQRHIANKSVLRYFKTYLRRKSLSDKIINRDFKLIEDFADFLARQVDETATLRDITIEAFDKFMLSMTGEISRATIVGLKRFFTYLKETDRIEWELADDLLIKLRAF